LQQVGYQLKRVAIAILNCASFHSLCCLLSRKGKFSNKQCFYRNNKMFCGIKSCNTCSIDTAAQSFFTCLLPCRWYVVQSRPRNPLFRWFNALLLLWKPHSWF